MYHVVVCSNCRYVWIVDGRPKTSQCRRCRKRRKFKLLKKYHKTDDKDEAKLARAFFQAQVNDQGEHFDRALERGVLEVNLNAFLSETEYLEMEGIDTEIVDNAVDNLLAPPNERRSEVNTLRDAFHELDNPDLDEVVAYAQKHDVSEDNAILKLEGLLQSGAISDPGSIELGDVEARIEERFTPPDDDEQRPQTESPPGDSISSNRDIILAAVEEHGEESVDSMLDYAEEMGMDRQQAVVKLEKLALSGQISPSVRLQAISDTRATLVADAADQIEQEAARESEEEPDGNEGDSSKRSLSQREIMEAAIDEQVDPTFEDVLEFASEHGLPQEKAERLLEKMRKHGEVMKGSDHTLRRI